jgi:hypothetical protein
LMWKPPLKNLSHFECKTKSSSFSYDKVLTVSTRQMQSLEKKAPPSEREEDSYMSSFLRCCYQNTRLLFVDVVKLTKLTDFLFLLGMVPIGEVNLLCEF